MTQFVERIDLKKLNNGRWFQIMSQFRTKVRELGAETLKYEDLWTSFTKWWEFADIAIKYQHANEFTEELHELDRKRDVFFSSLKTHAKAYLNDYDPVKVAAAKKVKLVFDNYGNVAKLDREQETAMISNLLTDLRTKHAAELTTLNLTSYTTELDKANKEFNNKFLEQDVDVAAEKLEHTMKECRVELGRVYDDIICRTDVFMIYFGVETWKTFVKEWNIIVEKYKELINLDETLREKDKDEEGIIQ